VTPVNIPHHSIVYILSFISSYLVEIETSNLEDGLTVVSHSPIAHG